MGSVKHNKPLIIDTHLHLWDTSKVEVSWIEDAEYFNRDFLLPHYAEEVKEWNVRAIYMEVDADSSAKKNEVAYINELIGGDNFLEAAVYFANPVSPDFEQWIDDLPSNAKGIRNILHLPEYPRGYSLQKKFVEAMHFLGTKQLSFDLCLNAAYLEDAITLAQKCPNTKFVMDHCATVHAEFDLKAPKGNSWEQWKQHIVTLGQLPNVYCKLSGLVSTIGKDWDKEDLKPVIGECLQSFDSDKIIIGSDWPICTLSARASDWYAALHQVLLEIDEEHVRSIFSENAIKLYGLEIE